MDLAIICAAVTAISNTGTVLFLLAIIKIERERETLNRASSSAQQEAA